jgi:hypothetical protein
MVLPARMAISKKLRPECQPPGFCFFRWMQHHLGWVTIRSLKGIAVILYPGTPISVLLTLPGVRVRPAAFSFQCTRACLVQTLTRHTLLSSIAYCVGMHQEAQDSQCALVILL